LGHDLSRSNRDGNEIVQFHRSYKASDDPEFEKKLSFGGTVRAVADATVPNNATLDTGGAIFDCNGFNLTLSGTLSGPGRITKINQGTPLLMGTNTYSGGTALDAGTLVVGSSGALGLGDVVVTFDNPFGLSGGFNTIDLIYARNSLTLEFLALPTAPAVIMTTDFAILP
jgi:hypothetical protein